MFDALHRIAERKIEQAIRRGELSNLRGSGKPLKLENDAHVPAAQRMAYRILKNSGYVPEEVLLRRNIGETAAALGTTAKTDPRYHALRAQLYQLKLTLDIKRQRRSRL